MVKRCYIILTCTNEQKKEVFSKHRRLVLKVCKIIVEFSLFIPDVDKIRLIPIHLTDVLLVKKQQKYQNTRERV